MTGGHYSMGVTLQRYTGAEDVFDVLGYKTRNLEYDEFSRGAGRKTSDNFSPASRRKYLFRFRIFAPKHANTTWHKSATILFFFKLLFIKKSPHSCNL